ncbi:Uncharacterised protein [uncultured Ruminococcus sp.]|nr:Uncharacterised protein [uncultured Ruminococcus sp.]
MVVFVDAHAVRAGQGLAFRKDGRAAVALPVGVVPILLVAGQVQINLTFLELCFLQAENIGVQSGKNIHKSFFHYGAQAVYIPGNAFHGSSSFLWITYCRNSRKFGIINIKYYFCSMLQAVNVSLPLYCILIV